MAGQKAIGRILDMLAMMSRLSGVSADEMAEKYNQSKRTIERTVSTLRKEGYAISCKEGIYYFNKEGTKKENGFNIEDLVYFTKEEAYVLNKAIHRIETDTSLRENLVRKLDILYDSDKLVNTLVRKEETDTIRIILEAIRTKTQVRIKEYTQSSSNKGYREIYIEPLGFVYNYSRIWAYLPYTKSNLIMHLSTIKEVRSTDRPFRFAEEHKVGFMDPFRSYGWTKFKIRLLLNHRSYGHMIDEFPLTYDCSEKVGPNSFLLDTEVCNYYQIGRFIQGFAEDVSILEPTELKEYVRTNLQKGLEQLDKETFYKRKLEHQTDS